MEVFFFTQIANLPRIGAPSRRHGRFDSYNRSYERSPYGLAIFPVLPKGCGSGLILLADNSASVK